MEKPDKFVVIPSSHLYCPVCNNVLSNPVISKGCGHSFCKCCAMKAVEEQGLLECPRDKGKASGVEDFFPNKAIEDQVNELRVYCTNALYWSAEANDFLIDRDGCQEKLPLREKELHKGVCEFAMISCPNNPQVCGRVRRKELDKHFRERCKYIPCRFKADGCEFSSKFEESEDHEKNCAFDPNKGGVQRKLFDKQVEQLKMENQDLRNIVNTLVQRLTIQEQTNKRLEEEILDLNTVVNDLRSEYELTKRTIETLGSRRRTMSRSSRPSSTSLSQLSLSPLESWTMPFQFKCIGTLKGHGGSVNSLTRLGSSLFSGDSDSKIKRWDLDSIVRGCCQTLSGHKGAIFCMCSSGNTLYSASEDGTVRSWSSEGVETKKFDHGLDNGVCCMIASNELLFTSSFQCIKVWSLQDLTLIKLIDHLSHWVRALYISHDYLYSGSHNVIQIWEANQNMKLKSEIKHSYGSAYSICVSKNFIILGTYNRVVQLFDISSHAHVKSLAGHIGAVTGLFVSPSHRFLFSCSADTTVQLWSLESLLPIQTLRRHEGDVKTLLLYGDILLSAGDDGEIKVFKYFMQMA